MRSCRKVAKRKYQTVARKGRKYRCLALGRTLHIIVEGPVMGLEKRECIIWPYQSRGKLGAIPGGTKGQKAKHAKSRKGLGALSNKSRMMGDYHVRIYKRLGVKFPGPT